MPPGPSADSLPGAICLALLVSFVFAQSEFASLNSLCNQTFEEANATGVYPFDSGVNYLGSADKTHRASWAFTIYENDTSIQPTVWYSAHGANYSDSFGLGFDVCAISLQNITLEAQYNGQRDNGSCLAAFDQDCVVALRELGIATANSLVTEPSSYGPNSSDWNDTIDAGGMAMTDYNYTNVENKCCSDFQDIRRDCPINGTYYPIIEAYYAETDPQIYDYYGYEIFPMLTIFMSIADYERPVEITTNAEMTCVHVDHFNAEARRTVPMPSPLPVNGGLDAGDTAAVVVGVLVGVALIAIGAFWDRRWRRGGRSKEEMESIAVAEAPDTEKALPEVPGISVAELDPDENLKYEMDGDAHLKHELSAGAQVRRELPHTRATAYQSYRIPELPHTRSHQKFELMASVPAPVKLPGSLTSDHSAGQ
ncbi:hypothetical protein LTR37_000425 [Vermiconidia calcicola]|uniref:Uncharacterized protein n=1 Tax=Vermiconidia calcicola TaxID=1690605 RepID=A0ACC3NZT3_9PEZI|nr:hypothetical protein LTR37_000425 [Vermiconidia calcicola]